MRIVQLGNFEPPHSTENEILDALRRLGHDVVPVQEQDNSGWRWLNDELIHEFTGQVDMIVWTSTISLNDQVDFSVQYRMLDLARRFNIPAVAVHLDRWWGLDREDQLQRPFFSCQYVYTADGGHQDEFREMGINHFWMPPAVSERWCRPGEHRDEYDCDVLFVGNWMDYGHREWKHRPELIEFLSRTYGDRFLALPRRNRPAIRGLELNDVYWSAKVVVGDSCLVPKPDGSPMTHYCSDRVPETLGRGGVLVHPYVEGVQEQFCPWTWELGDWDDLRSCINGLLQSDNAQRRLDSIEHTLERNTYTVRMGQVIDAVLDGGREIA